MPFSTAARLGEYEILASIAVGGTGEVYKAVHAPRALNSLLRARIILSLLLFSAVPVVRAGGSDFLLGLDYSQWLLPNVQKLATDASGAIYVLSNAGSAGQDARPSTVTKLSADGKAIVWQNQLGVPVSTMAIDPNGGVYVSPIHSNADVIVAKLNDSGSGIAWTFSTGITFPNGARPTLAADASGRVYVGGLGTFFRIAANGGSINYQQPLVGLMNSIAVDASGAAFVAGGYITDGILARFAPDGTPLFYTTFPDSQIMPTVALDPSGNAVVFSTGTASDRGQGIARLTRFDANGTVTSSTTPVATGYSGMGMDQAGNVYLMGNTLDVTALRSGPRLATLPLKNSLAACGTEFLTVLAPDGTVLQTTYLPGGLYNAAPLIAIKNGNVLIASGPTSSFAPTRTGPFPAGNSQTTDFLLSFSPDPSADTFPLACIGNAGGYSTQSISPGQVLALFGNGLGPQQGVASQATLQAPYPRQAGEVQVTFDGAPAPILWAQDGQVNVIAPWSLNTGANTEVCVSYKSSRLKCLGWPTAQTAPGVLIGDSSTDPAPLKIGTPQYAIALNQDGSMNSAANPAEAGSLVSVFATGLGPIGPPQADGSLIEFPLPVNSIPVRVEGSYFIPRQPTSFQPTEVTYAGPAPYRPAGISQVNFRSLTRPPDSYQLKLPAGTSPPFLIHVR